jgi:AraC family transcriptional regulator
VLAATTRLSPSRFHAAFRERTGETVKQHTLRIRLERAALRLLTEQTSVSDIAFDLGFGTHETFTRAFRRRFGVPPSVYRRTPPSWLHRPKGHGGIQEQASLSRVSLTTAVRMQPAHIAFVRHTGPYEDVDASQFATVLDWASRRHLSPIALCGIAHDAPGLTPPHLLRFDLGVHVSHRFRGTAEVSYQSLPARWCASTTYVGPFAGLADAYRTAFLDAGRLRGFQLLGPPVEEIYATSALLAGAHIQRTQILIPLRQRSS